ncbi:MAG TPA: hypothetical protein VM223_14835 [Planctomycetota bacterium]|nr:hypothetical protein [Planctomycetota bacterium]HUX16946.1 hypothetical protein [Phycisphaerae bacterium]
MAEKNASGAKAVTPPGRPRTIVANAPTGDQQVAAKKAKQAKGPKP